MTIGQIARTDVVTAPIESTLEEIAATMETEGVGSVVILDDGKPRGIVTDRDIVVYGVTTADASMDLTARNLMEEDLFTADVNHSVFDVIREMHDRGVRRVPLTDNGHLAGIVTLDDLIVQLATELEYLAEIIERESPPFAR